MSKHPDRYLVVGNPIAHSLSPQIHRAFADQFDENIRYEAVAVEPGGFAEFVDDFARRGGRGLNVTLPFKVDAFNYVDGCDELAQVAGAVNTISLSSAGPSQGFNTDGIGLLTDLTVRHGLDLKQKSILILGAGGAAQGVLQPLLQAQPRRVIIANRTVETARDLVARLQSNAAIGSRGASPHTLVAMGFDDINESPDVIINATSSGLSGGAELIDANWVGHAFCYDMSYGAAALFCAWAENHGAARSVDGLGMLVEQAAQSYYLWRGKRPRTAPVVAMLRQSLAS